MSFYSSTLTSVTILNASAFNADYSFTSLSSAFDSDKIPLNLLVDGIEKYFDGLL